MEPPLSTLAPRRIAREILRELFTNLFVVLGALLALVLAARLVQLREMLLGDGVAATQFLGLLGYLSPYFLVELLPVGCMLSVFLVFLRMASDRELLALKAHGVSLLQLLYAPLVFLTLMASVNFLLGAYGVSWGAKGFRHAATELARSEAKVLVRPGMFVSNVPGLTFYAKQVNKESGALTEVFIQDERKPDRQLVVSAPAGSLLTGLDGALTGLLLTNGVIHRLEGPASSTIRFERYVLSLRDAESGGQSGMDARAAREMSLDELWRLSMDPDLPARRGAEFVRKVQVMLLQRFSTPLACIALGLLAAPLASSFAGVRQQVGLLLALGIFLCYYALLVGGRALAELSLIPEWLGVGLPVAMTALAAAYSLRLTNNESVPAPVQWLISLSAARKPSGGAQT